METLKLYGNVETFMKPMCGVETIWGVVLKLLETLKPLWESCVETFVGELCRNFCGVLKLLWGVETFVKIGTFVGTFEFCGDVERLRMLVV